MATASTDETVKIWDISHNNGTDPKLIHSKEMKTGELFSLQFYKDIPWVLAAGGSKGELAIWDISENQAINAHFTPTLDLSNYQEVEDDES